MTDLTPEERERLETLFDRAAELPATERAEFVARECGAEGALRSELERLVAALDGDDLFARIRSATHLAPGTKVGSYEILEPLGEGGMGEVYVAEQRTPITRRVALKVMKLGLDSEQVVRRFEAERQALARMEHPNIARVLDAGLTPRGRPYFAMELVEGDPLTEYCDRHALTTRQRLELFLHVCAGVQHAHSKGIIHRDLKPTNLLVTTVDGRPTAKIIDFGIARATSGQLGDRTLRTVVGQIVGTLDYMSPEQADPTGTDIDTRSDIYSLGVVLYELVCGLLPLELSSARERPLSELQRTLRECSPPTPSHRLRHESDTAVAIATSRSTDGRALVHQLVGDLDWICLQALEKDPSRRYQTVVELADDVRRHLAHEPIKAGRPGLLYRARKFARRHRLGITTAGLAVGGLVVGVVGLAIGALEAKQRSEQLIGMGDSGLLRDLLDEADELWPLEPRSIERFEEWIGVATEVVSRLDRHREQLAVLRAGALPQAGEVPEVWHFADRGRQREHDMLSATIADIERIQKGLLADEPEGVESRWSVPQRLAFARQLEAAFAEGGAHARIWARDLPALRAAYPGLDLPVHQDLLPLGPDRRSGLWEFAHLPSGDAATRGPDGELVRTQATGIVLVLLPGATFVMGAQDERPGEANYDAHTVPFQDELGLHDARVEPIFVSKYELTRGQWLRFSADDPSQGSPMKPVDPMLPMTMVGWAGSASMSRRLGLRLPTEAEWEYALRGGTVSTWWWGWKDSDLPCAENVFELTTAARRPDWAKAHPPANWEDPSKQVRLGAGVEGPAPVGSYLPNPFGLLDMGGNVSEWCADVRNPLLRHARGGSIMFGASGSRSAARLRAPKGFLDPALGLRLVRDVQRQ